MPRSKAIVLKSPKWTCNRTMKNDSANLNQKAVAPKEPKTPKKRKSSLVTASEEKVAAKSSKKKKITNSKKEETFCAESEDLSEVDDQDALTDPQCRDMTTADFVNDDNVKECGTTNEHEEFPSDEEDENQSTNYSDDSEAGEEGEITEVMEEASNNNATIDLQPSSSNEIQRPNLHESFEMMQDFLLHKGVLTTAMSDKDKEEFMSGVQLGWDKEKKSKTPLRTMTKHGSNKATNTTSEKQKNKQKSGNSVSSVTTVYQNAVPYVNTTSADMFQLGRRQVRRKESSSSDDFVDTSDENLEISPNTTRIVNRFIAGIRDEVPGTSISDQNRHQQKEPTPEERAAELIVEAEQSRARMYEVAGELNKFEGLNLNKHSMLMDEDYQMIDAHLDETLKKKIWNFEYIDLSRLLNKSRNVGEETQHLGIINRGGVSYLTPVVDKESINIGSYWRWDQAFRIYSNVLTTRYPYKAPELYQYNHTIHAAATTYVWKNVYEYDKEFRYHISRHPKHSWGVILQQAWTMLLKNQLRPGGFPFNNNNPGQDRPLKEICKRLKKGSVHTGLAASLIIDVL